MIQSIKIFTVLAIFVKSSLTINLNQTAIDRSPNENATTIIPHNHKNTSELLDQNDFKVNSSLSVAESRYFPVGNPNLISSNHISPFDVPTFGQQLLPLIHSNIKEKVKILANSFNEVAIKEKVKDLAESFHEGADLIEDAIRDSWRNPLNPLNPNNFNHLLNGPGILKPFKKPHSQKAPHHGHNKEKAQKTIQTYNVDGMMHDYGINGYKHFEESILRELEKQEERKVEATIHTLFNHDDKIEIIHGKPYDYKVGWKPVAAPTKTYDDDKEEVNSQIVSPLHTSIFGTPNFPSRQPHSFHDFDDLNSNSVHSTYSVHEQEVESKVKPVKTRITPIRSVKASLPTTSHYPQPTTVKSRYRKRHNNNVVKTESFETTETSAGHDAPKIVNKAKRNPPRLHIQSLTTAKPNVRPLRTVGTEAPKFEVSTESSGKISFSYHSEIAPRARPSTTKGTTTKRPTTTTRATSTTTIKPSRNVPREAAKFVDKPKATGFRGSVKFGQTTTKKPL